MFVFIVILPTILTNTSNNINITIAFCTNTNIKKKYFHPKPCPSVYVEAFTKEFKEYFLKSIDKIKSNYIYSE